MKAEDLEYRMYGLVPYNLSPIQQGIQYGHAVVEYMVDYPIARGYTCTEKWATQDKTFIVLNGGTTNNNPSTFGTLNLAMSDLITNEIRFSCFYETDLGDQLSAVVFLVDERVWDNENYPFFKRWLEKSIGDRPLPKHINYEEKYPDKYVEWCNLIGGETNIWLKTFLKQFRLA